MEKITVDEIYKAKLREIRRQYQAIRNENNRKEFEAIDKLNQSYMENMYLLSRIETEMMEMQAGVNQRISYD